MSRQEQWAVDAQARGLAVAWELGTYRQGYKSGHHGLTQQGWGGFLIGLGLLAGVPFASQASGHAQAVLFGVAGVMAAVGVVLIKTAPREEADWIFLYAGGIAQVREGQPPRVVPWGRLDHVSNEYSPGTENTDPSLKTIRVTGVDGTVITAEASRCHGIGRLDRDIGQVVAEMRLPAALAPPAGERSTGAWPAILSEADVSTVLGWPMEAVTRPVAGGPGGQVFRGGGVTLSLTLRDEGVYSAIDRTAARRLGRALPGLGDEAWLIKGEHTILMRAGRSTVKLTLTDSPPSARAALLMPLAHIVAARLAAPPGG